MSDIAYDTIKECLSDITEDEAMNIFHDLRDKFGWAGSVFTKDDVQQAYTDEMAEDDKSPTDEMAEAVWQHVQTSYEWVNLADPMIEQGWYIIGNVVRRTVRMLTPDE